VSEEHYRTLGYHDDKTDGQTEVDL